VREHILFIVECNAGLHIGDLRLGEAYGWRGWPISLMPCLRFSWLLQVVGSGAGRWYSGAFPSRIFSWWIRSRLVSVSAGI
jgi:hypothetical protein